MIAGGPAPDMVPGLSRTDTQMDKQNQGFEWETDGWGRVAAKWGRARNEVLTYLRRLRKDSTLVTPNELPEFEHDDPYTRFTTGVIRDLVGVGWALKVSPDGTVRIKPSSDPDLSKEAVRGVQLAGRNDQLRQPAVRNFINRMEKRRLGQKGWHCIFSVMRDGEDLANHLAAAAANPATATVSELVKPYIQVADASVTCSHTGLNLYDIWRYFRYTWVNPYQSVPGRSISFLIRDAAAPNHPVIGIAALGSAVVHQTSRDELIGWETDTFLDRLYASPTRKMAQWLLSTIDRFISEVYILDLLADDTLRKVDLKKPDDQLIARLDKESLLAKERHFKNPLLARVSNENITAFTDSDWENLALTDLYRSKRCRLLASFLRMRKAFIDTGFTSPTPKALKHALKSGTVKSAIKGLVSRMKSERVGIDMMDITVCGALPPYTHLLGGKLVCMLLCSPEVRKIYERRYGGAPSIIASALKGKRLIRKPTLTCLSTTSLYGKNSSQYNRVRIPASSVGGSKMGLVSYQKGGGEGGNGHHSQGYGTFHFRQSTLDALEEWTAKEVAESKDRSARGVNYIFGEGTSPKLRKLRDKIEQAGLPGEEAIKHARSRIVYYIALAENVGDFLLGLEERPKWILPQTPPEDVSRRIAEHWATRWLAMRIQSPDVLEALRQHTLEYPVTHGARVAQVKCEQQQQDLFADES
jgi:hypothetical protein